MPFIFVYVEANKEYEKWLKNETELC